MVDLIKPLDPLFDQHSDLVGWVRGDRYLWDTQLHWVAFIRDGHIWSTRTLAWLGSFRNGVCLDRDGRIVGWCRGTVLQGGGVHPPLVTPALPPRPPMPAMPPKPVLPAHRAAPEGGWTLRSFGRWLSQQPFAAVPDDRDAAERA